MATRTDTECSLPSAGRTKSRIATWLSASTLPVEVPEFLLRGAPAKVLFDGLGRHLQSSQGDDSTYALSQQVETIDDFLTHDWQTAGWRKLVSLCFLYNSGAAFVSSCTVAVVAGVLQSSAVAVLPTSFTTYESVHGVDLAYQAGWWPLGLGAFVHVAVFLRWQHLRQLLGLKPRFIFLDKVCIHQSNEKLKAAAVSGLAGILKRSDRLVVLWSPKYLTRLWCVYEVASWLHLAKMHDGHTKTVIFPCSFAIGLLIFQLVMLTGRVLGLVVYEPLRTYFTLFSIATLVIISSSFVLMHRQLKDFDISKTSCFCCSVDHTDPETGAHLPCQRKQVYSTLEEWFVKDQLPKDSSERGERFLLEFNEQIQHNWGQEVLESMGNRRLIFEMGLVAASPIFWDMCCRLNSVPMLGSLENGHKLSSQMLQATLYLPTLLWISVWASLRATTALAKLPCMSDRARRCLVQVFGVLVILAALAAHQLMEHAIPLVPGALMLDIFMVVIAGAIFFSSFLRRALCSRVKEVAQEAEGIEGTFSL